MNSGPGAAETYLLGRPFAVAGVDATGNSYAIASSISNVAVADNWGFQARSNVYGRSAGSFPQNQ